MANITLNNWSAINLNDFATQLVDELNVSGHTQTTRTNNAVPQQRVAPALPR
jgi:putative NADH-flavin reductase